MSIEAAEKRVAKGVALLDRKHGPDWRSKVDPDTLEMHETCHCILGQVYGSAERINLDSDGFDSGKRALGIRRPELYGFDVEYGWRNPQGRSPYTFDELEQAWREELARVPACA